MAADTAASVEEAFQARLATLAGLDTEPMEPPQAAAQTTAAPGAAAGECGRPRPRSTAKLKAINSAEPGRLNIA